MMNTQNNSYHVLGRVLAQMELRTGAEIGVDRGHFSEYLFKTIPGLLLVCVDPWISYPEYETRQMQHDFNVDYNNTKKRLAPYAYNCKIIRKTSMEVASLFEQAVLDFVYIDANHNYKYVKEDIEEWSKKVRKGGIVAGDDYDWYDHKVLRDDVKRAVDEYVTENNIEDFYIIQKGRSKTWFFIK